MTLEGFPMRQQVLRDLAEFAPQSNWLPMRHHADRLCRTLVNVMATGIGSSCLTHTQTLAAGALLLAHEDIKGVSVLPYADLEDGVNFVSFNWDNVREKVRELFADMGRTNRIRVAGQKTFQVGYNVSWTADNLLTIMEGLRCTS
jgi:hypothetical protein